MSRCVRLLFYIAERTRRVETRGEIQAPLRKVPVACPTRACLLPGRVRTAQGSILFLCV